MIDYPNIQMPQLMNMQLQSPKMASPNANKDMGMKLLQAALQQNNKGATPGVTPQPAVGAMMPGGAMNITPPVQQVGILQRLLGGMAGGGAGAAMPPPMDSSNGLY